MVTGKISILLVDDHAIVREGYRALLKKQPDLEVIAEAIDGNQAYQQYKLHTPDVTIMDLSLPGQSGVETIARIKQRNPRAKILVFTMHQNPRFAAQAINAGALGYVTKSSPPEVLLNAIHDVYSGRRTLSPDIAQALALEKTGHETAALESLTSREFEILRLLAEGKSKEEIAQTLSISAKTVSNCYYLVKSKIGVNSDIGLVHWAIKMRLIDIYRLK
ncbi:transcriptional activator protein ExaE [Methyloglobulus morosus KoM1]|uniref:Transcriptional activator protein ExaE n=1 Tax=Methyloglobulus morosus KoM1 TaxID=1116472 RepID=V5C4N8_9GAMM|nr:response regulator transcription factor [Methyloglobulus morosus]ESS73457.1 transcriptional activator protein ExaE [Methyloglobulus morosus KoM1]